MRRATIGELADDLGVSVDTVRYYERRGLIPEPPRTAAGYRTYDDDDRWRLALVLRAKELGFTLREIGGMLTPTARPSVASGPNVRAAAADKLAKVEAERQRLDDVAARLARLVQICDDGDAGCVSLEVDDIGA